MIRIIHYLTTAGEDPFQSWLDELGDVKARVTLLRRIDRLAAGNFGDHRFLRSGVWELRLDLGPGYRVYFGRHGITVVLLLCGGTKRTQGSDIDRAARFLADFQRRRHDS
jgi:putative addiction module killer protein